MKPLIEIANQIHQIEKKLSKDGLSEQFTRNISRIKASFLELSLSYHDPVGEKYTDTRTDVEANITGELSDNMHITETIKPIVTLEGRIIQPGIVIVEKS